MHVLFLLAEFLLLKGFVELAALLQLQAAASFQILGSLLVFGNVDVKSKTSVLCYSISVSGSRYNVNKGIKCCAASRWRYRSI